MLVGTVISIQAMLAGALCLMIFNGLLFSRTEDGSPTRLVWYMVATVVMSRLGMVGPMLGTVVNFCGFLISALR